MIVFTEGQIPHTFCCPAY